MPGRHALLAALAAAAGLLAAGAASAHRDRPLRGPVDDATSARSDGVYLCRHGGIDYYLRFYADGTVLSLSAIGSDPRQVALQMRRDLREWPNGRGQCRRAGDRLTFTLVTPQGNIDDTAVVRGDGLDVQWYSHINKASDRYFYRFVRVPLPD